MNIQPIICVVSTIVLCIAGTIIKYKASKAIDKRIENYKIKNDKDGAMCLLVRVSPFGRVERAFLTNYRKHIKVKSIACQLGELFGYKNAFGDAYNQYEITFNNIDDLNSALSWLQKYLYEAFIKTDCADSFNPEVLFVRRRMPK